MNIWKGAILGDLSKHRDYEHEHFYDHILDNGEVIGFRTVDGEDYIIPHDYTPEDIAELEEEVLEDMRNEAEALLLYELRVNPITGIKFKNPELYAALAVSLGQKYYDYYVRHRKDGLVPTKEDVRAALDEYMENHVKDRYELILEHANEVPNT